MVAHAQQGGAVVGFAVLAVDVEVFESAPDQMGKQRAGGRIRQRHPHQIAAHGKTVPPKREMLHARQAPQYADKCAEFGDVVDKRTKQHDAFVGKLVDVVGDALVGVVGLAGQLQAVVFVPAEPVLLEAFGEMRAPAENQPFLQPVAANDAADNQGHIAAVFHNQRGHGFAVERGERVIKTLVPRGDFHAHENGKQREADDRRKQQPLAPLNFATPKRAGKVEELFE